MRPLLLALAASLVAAAPPDGAKGKVLDASEARSHVDQTATVEMTVRHARKADKQKSYFLDSEGDFADRKNLAVVIPFKARRAFTEAGVDDPAEHYRDKTIRVTGKIVKEGNSIRMRIEAPRAIVVVADLTPADDRP